MKKKFNEILIFLNRGQNDFFLIESFANLFLLTNFFLEKPFFE